MIFSRLISMRVACTIAMRKDKEPFVWMFLGLIFSWVAVLIIACLSKPQKIYTNQIENKTNNDAKQLIELKLLLENNIITQEEFDAKKKQILGL